MNRKDWEKSKKQMRKLLEQGIGELKELAAEASYMTDATSDVVKLEMDVHRQRNRLDKAQTRLGREVAKAASRAGEFRSTSQITRLIKEIHKLESAINQDETKIRKIPLSWSAARHAVAKKFSRKTPAARKSATRRKAALKKSSALGKKISRD